ncbi:MAG: immunoglobulin domain-containing protein [Verrucomicrobia bacterium]|nr:immunoglobulin domain-containing protein [Verrucomicrobiota bacterium]
MSDRPYELKRYQLPAGTTVPPRGFLAVSAAQFGARFLLDSANDSAAANDERSDGDEVILSAVDGSGALTGLRLRFAFGAAPSGVSFGREGTSIGDQVAMRLAPTPGAANSGAMVGPVVLTETRFQEDLEPEEVAFIELQNISTTPVILAGAGSAGWRLRGGVDFDFTGNVSLPPRGFALLVGFDPVSDAGTLASFRARYGVPASVRLLGPWHGGLHRGETLRIERQEGAQPPSRPEAGKPVYVAVDSIEHSDALPWPDLGVAISHSLQRRRPDGFANEPLNWFAASPTPGRPNRADSGFIDSDHDGLPDDWELSHGLDPSKASDAELDPDADGLSTWQEYGLGTNPQDPQSRATVPIVTEQPSSQTVGAGSTTTLRVVASGEPGLRYAWLVNGRLLAAATNAVLILKDVQPDASGDYAALVSTDAGIARSDAARLSVFDAPNILEHPQSLAVDPGANATFKVRAESDYPPLGYQWRFNGADIAGESSSTLNIAGAQLAQEGDYSVVVSDAFARSLSQTARLTVKVKPVITVQPTPTNQVAAAGGVATFSVSATGSLPMWFRWRRGTTTVTNIQVYSGTCVLSLPNLQTNQSGKYTVAVTNLAGGTTPQYSSGADLTVLLPPTITNQPISQVFEAGANASFTVGARGAAPLSYQWWFNTAPMPGATSASLNLTGVQAPQQGTYFVVVSNLVGQATSSPATLSLRLPSILSIRLEAGLLVLEWSAAPNLVYRLQSRRDLASGDWADISEDVKSVGFKATKSFAVPSGADSRYYRVVLLP